MGSFVAKGLLAPPKKTALINKFIPEHLSFYWGNFWPLTARFTKFSCLYFGLQLDKGRLISICLVLVTWRKILVMQVVAAIGYCYCYCEKSQPLSQGLLVLSLSFRTGRSLFRSLCLNLRKNCQQICHYPKNQSPKKQLPGLSCSKAD